MGIKLNNGTIGLGLLLIWTCIWSFWTLTLFSEMQLTMSYYNEKISERRRPLQDSSNDTISQLAGFTKSSMNMLNQSLDGVLIANKYRLHKKIGSGSFGQIYMGKGHQLYVDKSCSMNFSN